MATIPIYSPKLPFLGQIPGGLVPGRMVRLKGILNQHGERCQIHIQSGAATNPRDDVTLHISIRPNEHVIVRNTLQNQVVGPEERYGGCPIRYGEGFDLLILAEASQYKIAINGAHFCTFGHRLPLHNARYISVSGNCVIYSIISEADGAGALPINPYPPVVIPPAAPYVPVPPIGFVPHPPPAPLPPPPPYTPLPTYPVVSGGGGGHYPGHGWMPPPPPPPQPGYPHPPYPGGHPPAVPFSVLFKEELQAKIEKIKGKPRPF